MTNTLPYSWYIDSDVLAQERERLFARTWQYAGHTGQLAEPGSFFTMRAGDVPIVVVRDREGVLRAFVNVCRHRGAEVVTGEGRCTTLQCHYHAWTYGLDGALRAAPRSDAEPGFDRSQLGLLAAQVDTWGPFIFVNAVADAPPLVDTLGALPGLIADGGLDVDSLEFHSRGSYSLDANWKVAVENYLECYHCPVAHKGFSALVDVDPEAYRLEIADGVLSQFGERRGDGAGERDCQFHLIWPALKVIVYPGPANLSLGPVWPVGPERSAGFLDYFFGPDVPDETARELIEFDDEVGREDRVLVESVQQGLRSGLIDHGRLLLDSEMLIDAFQGRVAGVLSSTS